MSSYFDSDFLPALEALRLLARRVPAGGRHAEQRSRMRAAGVEFTDLRPYVPGDDFRAIDWHIFQRLDKVFLRLYLEDQDLPVYLLLDQSRSMDLRGEPQQRKTRCARQAAAAIAYLSLNHHDRVWLLPFADEDLRPLPGVSGRVGFQRVLQLLDELPAGGGTGLCAAVERFRHRRLRRGLCVLISDLYDPAGPEEVLAALGRIPHELLVVRPQLGDEAEPDVEGEVQLRDCETGESLALTITPELRRAYREAYEAFDRELRQTLQARAARLLQLDAEQPLIEQFLQIFQQGVMQV